MHVLLERLEDTCNQDSIEILSDFQLQVEHALDLENRKLVLFIDASVSCKTAYDFYELQALKDKSYSTHAMSPAAVLQVYQTIKKHPPPPAFLLSIQGLSFELGEDLSPQAENNLHQAVQFAEHLLENSELEFWRQQIKAIQQTNLCMI